MRPPAWHYFLLKSAALFPTSWRWCCCQTGETERERERDPGGELLMKGKFRQVSVEMPEACAHRHDT